MEGAADSGDFDGRMDLMVLRSAFYLFVPTPLSRQWVSEHPLYSGENRREP